MNLYLIFFKRKKKQKLSWSPRNNQQEHKTHEKNEEICFLCSHSDFNSYSDCCRDFQSFSVKNIDKLPPWICRRNALRLWSFNSHLVLFVNLQKTYAQSLTTLPTIPIATIMFSFPLFILNPQSIPIFHFFLIFSLNFSSFSSLFFHLPPYFSFYFHHYQL